MDVAEVKLRACLLVRVRMHSRHWKQPPQCDAKTLFVSLAWIRELVGTVRVLVAARGISGLEDELRGRKSPGSIVEGLWAWEWTDPSITPACPLSSRLSPFKLIRRPTKPSNKIIIKVKRTKSFLGIELSKYRPRVAFYAPTLCKVPS